MGDLTRALVDLGVAAERRRNARADLRAAIPTIVTEMLRHLRTGDSFDIHVDVGLDYPERLATYEVERVLWRGNPEFPFDDEDARVHPRGAATLVRWPGPADPVASGGAVLLDPRKPWTVKEMRPVGFDSERVISEITFKPDTSPTGLWTDDDDDPIPPAVHIATDEELVLFADEVERVISGFSEGFAEHADRMSRAVKTTSKFGPK